jgi:hypothetical protein
MLTHDEMTRKRYKREVDRDNRRRVKKMYYRQGIKGVEHYEKMKRLRHESILRKWLEAQEILENAKN